MRWADGRAHRLTRKRHFADVDPELVRTAAESAAHELGKVVSTVRDRYVPDRFVWLQFADYKVGPGEPCPCGSRRLLRVHMNFGRCPQCQAQLVLSDEVEEAGDPSKARGRAVRTLRKLTNVHLERRPQAGKRELYRGYGLDGGAPVFLLVEVGIEDDAATPENVFDRVLSTRVVQLSELDGLAGVPSSSVDSLWGEHEPNWDLVW